jgi:protein-tyrosine phosphatase
VTRISFVCSGNICRSPTAEVVMRHLVHDAGRDDEFALESAGTGGWHVGADMDRRTALELRTRGYDTGRHRAQQFTVDDFARLDVVVALDLDHLDELRAMAPTAEDRAKVVLLGDCAETLTGAVPDPYYGGPSGFRDVLDQVEDGCRGLLARLT